MAREMCQTCGLPQTLCDKYNDVGREPPVAPPPAQAAEQAHPDTIALRQLRDRHEYLIVQNQEQAAEAETLRAELAAWKEALGGAFGPQTPAEVAVFQRESERVNGQVAATEISSFRALLATHGYKIVKINEPTD